MKEEPTSVIVSSDGEYFFSLAFGFNGERGVMWTPRWEHAYVFRTRHGAKNMLRRIEGRQFFVKAAVIS